MRVNQSAPPRRRALLAAWSVAVAAAAAGCAGRAHEVPALGAPAVRQYLGDASRAATVDEVVSGDPRQRWRASAGRGTVGAIALGDSVAVVASVDRWITALDARDGRLFWHARADAPLGAGPLVDGGRVFVAEEGGGGRVIALRLRDGKRRWRRGVGAVTSPLVLDGGTVYGATRSGVAFALRAEDGRPRWRRDVGSGTRSGPLVVGGRIALVTVADTLVVLDAAGGRVETRRALLAGVVAPLARIDDSTIAVASPGGAVMAVALPRGEMRWRVATGAPVFGAPVVTGDTVYVLTNRCTLWAIPARAPSASDTLTVPAAGGPSGAPCTTVAAPALVRGGVLVATVGGTVLYLDRATRHVVWTRQAPGELRHPPSIRNGQVVVAPLLGDVVSFR